MTAHLHQPNQRCIVQCSQILQSIVRCFGLSAFVTQWIKQH
jgi:hypothetical protein